MSIRGRIKIPKKGDILRFLVAVSIGVLVSLSITFILQEPEWKPLGPYPVQQVDSQGPLVDSPERGGNLIIPQVKLGSTVHTTGQKCAKEDVTVQGEYGWRSVVPNGYTYEMPKGAPGRRLKGCESLDFDNHIPSDVDAWAREVIENGRVPEVYLGGCETPIREDGHKGATVCWRTEPFVLVAP